MSTSSDQPAAVAARAEDRVRIEIADYVAIVTLTRPDKHNALDIPMFDGIIGAAQRLRTEPGVRVVVLLRDAVLSSDIPAIQPSAQPVTQVPRPEPPKVPASGLSTTPPAPRTTQPGVPVVIQPRPRNPATGGMLKIDLKANEAAWVGIYENDKLTFAKVMEAGQTKSVESSAKVRVQLGNAGGVELAVNGNPSGSLGIKGQVRTVEVTAGGVRAVDSKPKTP